MACISVFVFVVNILILIRLRGESVNIYTKNLSLKTVIIQHFILYKIMKRIALIDALRGFALLLILLFHFYDGFGTGVNTGGDKFRIAGLDLIVTQFMYLIVIGKAFAIFSIMFGFSFFIQMDRSSMKGENFSMVFARRLLILLVIGYLHALIYRGDILTKYAVIGFLLLLVSRFNSRILTVLAALLLMQIPLIYSIIQSTNIPSGDLTLAGTPAATETPERWEGMLAAYTGGSFFDVIKVNALSGFYEIWKLNILSGRILLIPGYFILGLLLGRTRFFENIDNYLKYLKYFILGGALMYGALRFLKSLLVSSSEVSPHTGELIDALLNDYMNIFLTIIILSAFILIYHNAIARRVLNLLVPYGRMGLTSYITQGLIGVFMFYGFGLALFRYSTPFLSVIAGLGILAIQLVFSHFWLKHYAYGPIEWVWRSLTYPKRKISMKRSADKS